MFDLDGITNEVDEELINNLIELEKVLNFIKENPLVIKKLNIQHQLNISEMREQMFSLEKIINKIYKDNEAHDITISSKLFKELRSELSTIINIIDNEENKLNLDIIALKNNISSENREIKLNNNYYDISSEDDDFKNELSNFLNRNNSATSRKIILNNMFNINSQNEISTDIKNVSLDNLINNEDIKQNIFTKVLENMKINLTNEKYQLKMSLKPDFLGEMVIDMISKDGLLEAKAYVKNEIVKEIIENNIIEFKDNLKQIGINLEKFSVIVEKEFNFNQQNNSKFWNKNKNNRNKKALIKEIDESYNENNIYDAYNIKIGTVDLKA